MAKATEKGRVQETATALLILYALIQIGNGLPVETLIYGGVEAIPGEYPWMVSIQTPRSDDVLQHICGATLISPTKVVTAAHCVSSFGSYPPGSVKIVAGAHNISRIEASQQIRNILRVYTHKLYNKDTLFYDIAIIEVSESDPFVESFRVSWALIPPANMDSVGTCEIAGWGVTGSTGAFSDVLLKANIPIVSKDDCGNIYQELYHNASQICAGRPEGGVDTCQGDTGGGIFCSNNTGYKFFSGVASSGYFCGMAGKPGIYTEISRFITWLNNPRDNSPVENYPEFMEQ